jgi:hypothetical protein
MEREPPYTVTPSDLLQVNSRRAASVLVPLSSPPFCMSFDLRIVSVPGYEHHRGNPAGSV